MAAVLPLAQRGIAAQTFGATTPCGQHYLIGLGQTLAFPVTASAGPGESVSLNVAGLPPGARTSPVLPITGSPAVVDFSWTPAQTGAFVLVFVATNLRTNSQSMCSITAHVSSCRGSALTYGAGCAPATVDVPLLSPFGCASPGQALSIELSRAQPGALATLMFSGAAAATPLSGASFPSGCQVLIHTGQLFATVSQPVSAYGQVNFTVPLPVGFPAISLHTQGVVFSATASLALTRGVAAQVR
jgi:hypothetical protein